MLVAKTQPIRQQVQGPAAPANAPANAAPADPSVVVTASEAADRTRACKRRHLAAQESTLILRQTANTQNAAAPTGFRKPAPPLDVPVAAAALAASPAPIAPPTRNPQRLAPAPPPPAQGPAMGATLSPVAGPFPLPRTAPSRAAKTYHAQAGCRVPGSARKYKRAHSAATGGAASTTSQAQGASTDIDAPRAPYGRLYGTPNTQSPAKPQVPPSKPRTQVTAPTSHAPTITHMPPRLPAFPPPGLPRTTVRVPKQNPATDVTTIAQTQHADHQRAHARAIKPATPPSILNMGNTTSTVLDMATREFIHFRYTEINAASAASRATRNNAPAPAQNAPCPRYGIGLLRNDPNAANEPILISVTDAALSARIAVRGHTSWEQRNRRNPISRGRARRNGMFLRLLLIDGYVENSPYGRRPTSWCKIRTQ